MLGFIARERKEARDNQVQAAGRRKSRSPVKRAKAKAVLGLVAKQ
jgi:hypothetical protein